MKERPGISGAGRIDAVGIDSRLRHRTGLAESIIPLDGRRRGAVLRQRHAAGDRAVSRGLLNATTLVWLTYSPGQMLIVFGALAVCPLLVGHGALAGIRDPRRRGSEMKQDTRSSSHAAPVWRQCGSARWDRWRWSLFSRPRYSSCIASCAITRCATSNSGCRFCRGGNSPRPWP